MCSLLAFLFPVLTFASRDRSISDSSVNTAHDEIWTMQGSLLPTEGRRDTWKSLSWNLGQPLRHHGLSWAELPDAGAVGGRLPCRSSITFSLLAIPCSKPAQAGGKVNSSDWRILLLYSHISWFKMKVEAPHSKFADFKSQLVKKKWFGFNILVLSQKRNRLHFWAL